MKHIKLSYILSIGFALIAMAACRDESKIVYDTTKLPTGAYVRNLTLPPETSVIADYPATTLTFHAEVVGVNSAADITSLTIKVRHVVANSTTLPDNVNLGSITTWAVEPSTSELPRGSVSFKGSDVLTALGITTADLAKGDYIEYTTTLTLKDGRVYDQTNFDPNMINSFYLAGYDFLTEMK